MKFFKPKKLTDSELAEMKMREIKVMTLVYSTVCAYCKTHEGRCLSSNLQNAYSKCWHYRKAVDNVAGVLEKFIK